MTITSTHKPHIDDLVNSIDMLIVSRIKQHNNPDFKSQQEGEVRAKVLKEVIATAIISLVVHL